jgi:hypothetical protein
MPAPVLSPGDVVRIEDRDTIPAKIKIHICVCMAEHVFIRINSKPIWHPCHMLLRRNNQFLDHDSYAELNQLVRHSNHQLQQAEIIGRLTSSEAAKLVAAAERAETLSEEHITLIRRNLSYP